MVEFYKYMNSLDAKNIEPEPRLVGGKFGMAIHRFPIKGGITFAAAVGGKIEKLQSGTIFLDYMAGKS